MAVCGHMHANEGVGMWSSVWTAGVQVKQSGLKLKGFSLLRCRCDA